MAYEDGNYVPEVTGPEELVLAEEDDSDDVILARSIRAQTRPNHEPAWVTGVLGPRPGWKSYDRIRC